MRTAVVVVNFRTPELVLGCVAALEGQVLAGRDLVVVVDNDSGDDSVERIERAIAERGWGEWVRLVQCGHNGGFSAGNNTGIRAVDAESYLLLNSDAVLRPGALDELRRAAHWHPEAGLIGPRLESADGSPQTSAFRDRSPAGEFVEAADAGPISRLLGRYEVVLPVSHEPIEADWLSFACVWVRGRVLEQIGELDEGYFMYYEDIDYCRRARAAGWRVLYWPTARAVHAQGGTPPPDATPSPGGLPAYFYSSRSRYFAKFYGRRGLWVANFMWLAGRAISTLREAFGQRPRRSHQKWRNLWQNALRPLTPERRR